MNIKKSVFHTLVQFIAYVAVMRVILRPLSERIKVGSSFDLLLGIILPMIAGIVICLLMNKSYIKFAIVKNVHSKKAVYDLLIRLGVILLILFIGAILEKATNYGNRLSSLFKGDYGKDTIYFLCSFVIYVFASIFPLSYAVTHFLFIEK